MRPDNKPGSTQDPMEQVLERLVRIETRQAKTMRYIGLEVDGTTRRRSPLVEDIVEQVDKLL